ncbi:MAG: site-specific DNA-methyltransferase [Myxococcota bacterium]|nr:site-specific DNA-methyltransferase [Myxococcota bacterium]
MPGDLYYGDNLDVLRRHVANESVDLVYLDPPFNSDRTYNLIHKGSRAQERAFVDTWTWDDDAESSFRELTDRVPQGVRVPPPLREMMLALRVFLDEHRDMLAYLSMMAIRLVEMRRVLRKTGSIYVHCDPTASHYLKLILDTLFGPENFRREIIWRSGWVSGFKTKTANWIRNHDTLLYYLRDRSEAFTFNKDRAYKPHADGYARRGGGGNPKGIAIDDVWDEVALYSPWIKSFSTEKLGYMTQKPLALLERILSVSSNEGDVVLDPFCGCGTTVHAAEALGRRWIGIDVAIRAIEIIKDRLDDKFATRVWTEHGEPADTDQAAHLAETNAYDFQWWALRLLGGRPPRGEKKKGGDGGVDGELALTDGKGTQRRGIVSVTGGRTLMPALVKALSDTVRQEKADFGVLVTMHEPTIAMRSMARDYEPLPWAGDYSGRLAHRIRIITVPEIMAGMVQWPGRLDPPRSQSAPPPPEARTRDTLRLPFAPRRPAKAKQRGPGSAKANEPSNTPVRAFGGRGATKR